MRKLILLLNLLLSATVFAQSAANDTTPPALGLPGDNLNLSLVLNLFKQSSSIEDFEKQLNNSDNAINNLDLNNDGNTDYLRVVDYGKGDYHTIVIQDPVSASETQDVAIISIEKKGNDIAHVQIVGDESLYGKNYIIEPQLENTTQNITPETQPASPPPTVINNNYYSTPPPAYVNVWGWPSVEFIFGMNYVPWVSPWYWSYYPVWWHPWPHVYYHAYCARFYTFGWHGYYRTHRFINRGYYNTYYAPRRAVSPTVQVNITKNVYRTNTYDNNTHFVNKNYNGQKPYKSTNGNAAPSGQNTQNKNNWGGMNKPQSNNPNVYQHAGQSPEKTTNNNGVDKWGGMNKPQQGNSNPYSGKSQGNNGSNKWGTNTQSAPNNPYRGGNKQNYGPKPSYNNNNHYHGGNSNGNIRTGTRKK